MNALKDWDPVRMFSAKLMGRIIGALFVLLLLSFGVSSFYKHYLQSRWATITVADDSELTKNFQDRFRAFEQSIHRSLDSIESLPSFQLTFSTDDDSVQESIFFTQVLPALRTNLSFDLYDEDEHLIGWNGPQGPFFKKSNLTPYPHTFVEDDQIYTYLLISHPVDVNGSVAGYVVGKRLLDVDYPINNRFINREAFETSLGVDLPRPEEYDFSGKPPAMADSERLPVELSSLNGTKLGYAYLHKESLETRLLAVSAVQSFLVNFLLFCVVVILITTAVAYFYSHGSPLVKAAGWTVLLWSFRYFLIVTNFPSGELHIRLFDPIVYASSFGYGLAQSVGDLFVSTVILVLNVFLLIRSRIGDRVRGIVRMWRVAFTGKLVAFILVLISAVLSAASLRAYLAIVRSTVFDSTITFNDPSSVFPSFEMMVMLLSLLLITMVLILFSLAVGVLMKQLTALIVSEERHFGMHVGLIMLCLVPVGLLFGKYQSSPLVGPLPRLLFLLGVVVLTYVYERTYRLKTVKTFYRWFLPLFILSVIFVIPAVDRAVHDCDRTHLELAARESSQPVDSWLSLVVQEALNQVRDKSAIGTLSSGDTDEVNGLAFREWAKSILGREGYICSVTYVDLDGRVVSDFHIGIPPHAGGSRRVSIPLVSPAFHSEERMMNGRATMIVSGYAPVIGEQGDSLGGVLIEVARSRQDVLESEVPEFLRNYPKATLQIHTRPLVYSEYYEGRLTYSTADSFPLARGLPTGLIPNRGQWVEELIDGRMFESFYLPEDTGGMENSWVSLSMPLPTLRFYVYSYLRYLVFFLLLFFCIFLTYSGYDVLIRKRRQISFRQKVLIGFCVVSVIPVIVLGYFNKRYATRQSEQSLERQLDEQTVIVLAEIQHQIGNVTPAALTQFTDERCAQVAAMIKTDFNIYLIRSFFAGSKPEIFLAGVLDPRISADAYANVVVQRKRFFIDHQQIGLLPYIVGYRPILAEDGSIIGLISVPTLYTQIEMNEDLTRRNSFLYGVYVLAILLSILAGTAFANQISAPLKRLMLATRQVGSGQLDVRISRIRMDEIGELEQAFQQMTQDLRRIQAEMMRAQRELAWREMAKQVAHEIKNPLTPMKLAIQHLRQAYTDGVKNFRELFQQVSDTLLEQIDTLNRIASEFSLYAKMPERKPEPCDLQQIIREAVNLHRQHTRITFREEYEEQSCLVLADREEMRRVFINLLQNSIQAIDGPGKITVSCKCASGNVEITITDTGVGIPAALHDRIFEPNFSTKTEGMGLGLAIVKQIVDDARGSIDVKSSSGAGTSVTIRFPIANPAS